MKGKVPVLPQGVRPEGEAELMVTESPPGDAPRIAAEPGTLLSHYRVVREIGRGGMGIVYLAVDLTLGREVALKCPRPDLAGDPRLRQRFLHEARTASKLSHPNIVAVYEVFEERGLPWLATEYVDGEDLGTVLGKRRPLPIEELLRHAEGLSDALGAAHAKNILHRDIKPHNVLIGSDGRARLGDFGLARVAPPADDASLGTTRSASLTAEGRVVGTKGYMSPEQAMGKPVDGRSDVFCLGAVIYEMATGRPAFDTASPESWLDSLLHRDPPSIALLNEEAPEDLHWILRKALAKRPDERYQDARDMQADLRALRRRVESGSHPAEPASRPLRRRAAIGASVAAIAVVAAATVLLLWFGIGRGRQVRMPTGVPRQVTSGAGWAAEPQISPDGSMIAYTSNAAGNADVWVMDTRGGVPLRLTADAAVDSTPRWFPDGSTLAFVSDRSGERSIWKVPRLGGPAVLLMPGADCPAISPDGERIAFARADPSGEYRIAVAPIREPSKAVLVTHDDDGLWSHLSPAWSPDGRTLCYQDFRDLWTVPPEGGPATRLTTDHETSSHCAWSPDGRWVYFSSRRGGTTALWRIPSSGGDPERLTMGPGPEQQPALSRDASRLAFSTYASDGHVIVLDGRSGEVSRLAGFRRPDAPCLAPDGSGIVLSSDRLGRVDLWLQPLRGIRPEGPPRQLTEQPGSAAAPAFSPDGRWVAYFRVFQGRRDIWIVPTAGGIPVPFTDGPKINIHPAWSPDGSSLAFSSDRDGGEHLWIAPVADGRPAGPPRQVTSGPSTDMFPAWSPDGKILAFMRGESDGIDVWLVASDGTSLRRLTRGAGVTWTRWEASGEALLVSGRWGGDRVRLRRVLLPDGRAVPFEREISFGGPDAFGEFTLTRDGRVLAYVEEESRGEIWMLEADAGTF